MSRVMLLGVAVNFVRERVPGVVMATCVPGPGRMHASNWLVIWS